MRFLLDKKGNVMPYMVFLVAMLIMPLMVMTMEITRAMYVNVHLQAATDAACSAAAQAANVPGFIETGNLNINITDGRTYAYREFNSTVSDSTLRRYAPALTNVDLLTNTMVSCEAVAQMDWILPGIPPLVLHVNSLSEIMARR